MNAFPRQYIWRQSRIVAVSESMRAIPAYEGLPVYSHEQMRDSITRNGGCIMQQDDGYSPAFVLVDARELSGISG